MFSTRRKISRRQDAAIATGGSTPCALPSSTVKGTVPFLLAQKSGQSPPVGDEADRRQGPQDGRITPRCAGRRKGAKKEMLQNVAFEHPWGARRPFVPRAAREPRTRKKMTCRLSPARGTRLRIAKVCFPSRHALRKPRDAPPNPATNSLTSPYCTSHAAEECTERPELPYLTR